jgi:hypothetical protein
MRNWTKAVHLVRRGPDQAVPWSGAAWTNFLDQRQLDQWASSDGPSRRTSAGSAPPRSKPAGQPLCEEDCPST